MFKEVYQPETRVSFLNKATTFGGLNLAQSRFFFIISVLHSYQFRVEQFGDQNSFPPKPEFTNSIVLNANGFCAHELGGGEGGWIIWKLHKNFINISY